MIRVIFWVALLYYGVTAAGLGPAALVREVVAALDDAPAKVERVERAIADATTQEEPDVIFSD